MNIRYLSLHRVIGIIGLPGDADVELLPAEPSGARAFLTTQKGVYLEHLRRCKAFGATIAQGLMGQQAHLTRRELFDATLAQTQISEGIHFDKPLLVIEVSGEIDGFDPTLQCDYGHAEFAFGMKLFDEVPLAASAKDACQAATSGILLAISHDITATIESLGSVAYVIEEGTGRLIYSTSPTISGSHRSYSSLPEAVFTDAVAYSRSLQKDPTLETVVRLLSQSAQVVDPLQSFLTAWAGLEVFLDKTFKSTYEAGIFATIEGAATPSAGPFIERLREVMNGKYNIRDKFIVIASALAEVDADEDIKAFKQLKKIRDNVHTMSVNTASLPVDKTRNLLRKYLRLHLTGKSP